MKKKKNFLRVLSSFVSYSYDEDHGPKASRGAKGFFTSQLIVHQEGKPGKELKEPGQELGGRN